MSVQSDHQGHAHTEATEHHGGGPTLYWTFAVILCLITLCEWMTFRFRLQLNLSNEVLVPLLLGLSAIKFTMVVGWYMHLRYDPGWLKKVFLAGLVMGGGTAIALIILIAHRASLGAF